MIDKMCCIYTSGTTGLPKACQIYNRRFDHLIFKHMQATCTHNIPLSFIHTHTCRFIHYVMSVHSFLQLRESDIIYCTLPLYHTNGGVLCSGQMLFGGATLVLRKKFSASNFWRECVRHQCTVSLASFHPAFHCLQ